jgi:tRNA pseudouridine38-40 synthase
MSSAEMSRWRATCAYDGAEFFGWQSQKGGGTVQDYLEARLAAIFHRPVRLHGSGRTDAGVHARAQVFHFDADWAHPVENLLRALNAGRPRSLLVTSLRRAAPDFHARFSAKGKRYCYRIYLGYAPPFTARYCWSFGDRALDVETLRTAARRLVGRHDFTAFAGRRLEESEQPVKDLRRLDVTRRGRQLTFTLEASGFLYKMARGLVGGLVDVGQGKLAPEELEKILHSHRRTPAITTVPPEGLCLEKVFY